MSIRSSILYIVIITAVFCAFPIQSQTLKDLEKERKETLKNLEATNNMLTETKKSKQSSLNKLSILNNNIKERKKLINNINKEVDQLENEIETLISQQKELEKKLEALKQDYAILVREAHINRNSNNKILFLLSAKSFDQTFRRLRYMQEYSAYRQEQAKEIERVTAEIKEKNRIAEEHRQSKVTVLHEKEDEAKKLTKDQQSEKKMLTDLQKKENNLKTQLQQQQKKAAQLNKKIEQIIAEEIRKAEEKKRKEQQKQGQDTTSTSKKAPPIDTLTKEEQLINGGFENNRGRLPWPVERGFISGSYGVQPHPVLKHVTTNNKGIYIQTPAGSIARAVFEGEVTQRFSIPGSNNAVIVKHGNYRTVYANLTDIYVKVGDKVTPKQRIGKIYTDDESDNKTELYFQLWKGKDLMNPEPWIAK